LSKVLIRIKFKRVYLNIILKSLLGMSINNPTSDTYQDRWYGIKSDAKRDVKAGMPVHGSIFSINLVKIVPARS